MLVRKRLFVDIRGYQQYAGDCAVCRDTNVAYEERVLRGSEGR